MCRIVTIDIETLPAPEPEDLGEMSGKKLDEYLKTSLSGDFGRILCIGYIAEDERGSVDSGVIGWNASRDEFGRCRPAFTRTFPTVSWPCASVRGRKDNDHPDER